MLTAGSLQAQSTFKVASGDWTNAASWNGGVPTASGQANIGYPSPGVGICTAYIHSADSAVCRNLSLGGTTAGNSGTLVIEGGALSVAGNSSSTLGASANCTGIVIQTGGTVTVTNSGTVGFYVGYNDASSYGSWTISGGVFTNATSGIAYVGDRGTGRLIVNGTGRYVHQSSAFRLGNGAATANGTLVVADGGRFESATNATTFSVPSSGSGSIIVTNGGTMAINDVLNLGSAANMTGTLFVASGGVFSNGLVSSTAIRIGALSSSARAMASISNGSFHAEGTVTVASTTNSVFPAAIVELDGTQRVFRIGSAGALAVGTAADRQGIISNHVRRLAGGVDVENTSGTALSVFSGSRIHLAFDENPTQTGDFWGLRWAGTNGYAQLVGYTNNSRITVANNLTAPFNTNAITVYRAADNSYTYIGFHATVSATVSSGTVVMMR
jgi:hypothetical protein